MQPLKRPNSDRFPEMLEVRLRALPPPPVPSDLEARLLLAIPPEMSREIPRWALASRYRRVAVWAGAATVSAAACLLAVLLWAEPGKKRTGPRLVLIPERSDSPHLVAPQQPVDSVRITPWMEVRRGLDGAERPTFTWPIQDESRVMVSRSIPSDLFD